VVCVSIGGCICIEKGGVGLLVPKEQAFRPIEL